MSKLSISIPPEPDFTVEEWLQWKEDFLVRARRRLAVNDTANGPVDFSDLEQEASDLRRVRDCYQWLGRWPEKDAI